MRKLCFTCLALGLALCAIWANAAEPAVKPILWELSTLDALGGHATTVVGRPKLLDAAGKGIEFDGKGDALFVENNPLEGLKVFTAEVVFRPAAAGPQAQRFLHFQEAEGENRLLFETRLTDDGRWFLDTFIKSGDGNYTLFAEKHLHPIGPWYSAAVTMDGTTMRHYVNGQEELRAAVEFVPQRAGRTSLGVRMNQVFWYRGAIRQVRITPRVLAPAEFLKP